ncbi:hypothetical protein [Polymorphospora rubra]|uniref:Uncharacterized protein n=1 Tax=Polymorphospora rubra TaxID=338584 RepID=A0A810MVP3_9ACTN|nr:hypothetical protein [Polymorphospora rubra]BCJ65092.1 hypothetical protein Prubr_21130 [Polymorphospora rubra]
MTTVTTPPARHVAEVLADDARVERFQATHADALRKLATAVKVAVGSGATMAEILAVVEKTAPELASTDQLAANARAYVHNGDEAF